MTGAAIAALLLALGVAACGDSSGPTGSGSSSEKGADLPAGIIAQFADQQITEEELNRVVEQSLAQAGQQGQTAPKAGTPEYDALRRQALESIRTQRLVEVESRKCGKPCEVTEKEIDAELKKVRDQSFEGSQKKLDDFLKQAKLTEADARRILKLSLQQPKLFTRVTRGVRFTEADARKYYDANTAQFQVPEARVARHILVDTKAAADRIRAGLTTENFAAVAKKESKDPGSAPKGGDLGAIQKGQLVPEFEKVAFALEDGAISDPVKTQFGWHVITVKITPARARTFDEAKREIVTQQLQQKRNATFEAFRTKIVKEWDKRAKYADPKLDPKTELTPPPPPAATAPSPPAGSSTTTP